MPQDDAPDFNEAEYHSLQANYYYREFLNHDHNHPIGIQQAMFHTQMATVHALIEIRDFLKKGTRND